MGSKDNHNVKGLLKGLRYITQVFEDDKKKPQEIQIGGPTDVKHVAHIGSDGPAQESPGWMKGYGSPAQSASPDMFESPSDGPDWLSEDSGHRTRSERHEKHRSRHHHHRRRHSVDNALLADSEGNDLPTKSRKPRRRHTRGSDHRHSHEHGERDDSPNRRLPDIPRRGRRKKHDEDLGGGSTRSSRSKADEISSHAGSDAE